MLKLSARGNDTPMLDCVNEIKRIYNLIDYTIDCIYSLSMEITFDADKNVKNIGKHGLPFERVNDFDFDTAIYRIDDRWDYGETRIFALGYLRERLHSLVFVDTEKGVRVISFRKATPQEVRYYERKTEY